MEPRRLRARLLEVCLVLLLSSARGPLSCSQGPPLWLVSSGYIQREAGR